MNETRRKSPTGRQSPSLSDKWHGIFYMPSRIDTAGHTKAFDYPVMEQWGENRNVQPARTRIDNTSAQSRMRYQLSHPGFVCTTTLLTVVNVESRCLSASTLILSISPMMNCLKGTTLGWKEFLSYCKRWLFRRDPLVN